MAYGYFPGGFPGGFPVVPPWYPYLQQQQQLHIPQDPNVSYSVTLVEVCSIHHFLECGHFRQSEINFVHIIRITWWSYVNCSQSLL